MPRDPGSTLLRLAPLLVAACGGLRAPGDADVRFDALAQAAIRLTCEFQPTQATYLGIHDFDDRFEDFAPAAIAAESARLRRLEADLAALAPDELSAERQLDREMLLHACAARRLNLEVVRPFEKNPDLYSSGATNCAYIMIKRAFAPAERRLELLIAREQAMPAAFAVARTNLVHPPRVFTEIALEQLDGNREFFASAVPAAFATVKDAALLARFKVANDAVLAAFDSYKQWLAGDLLARSDGTFALGAETYRKKLAAEEMVDLPLAELERVALADLAENQRAFAATAAKIDAGKPPRAVLDGLQKDHPRPSELIARTQGELDALARFLTDHHLVTIPPAPPARVQETPPFLRATTSASMDTPGPFEKTATEAYYSMTLPDPASSAAEQEEFMTQWYDAAITNVSVHEVWPGHYLQFLYAPRFPTDVRRVFSANTNVEGWAHYCEQMVLDEGLHADDPRYRLAQLQDALLRDARFVCGIRLHTEGMTVAQAQEFFVGEAYQPAPVAESEAKRGTSDATYGYYTLGKLMIRKLRDDLRARDGAAFSLQRFHDDFIGLGPLPLPLVRRALLGAGGRPL